MSTETHAVDDDISETALRRVDEAVCALDDEWQFTLVNEQAAAILDQSPETLLGETLWEAVPDIEDGEVGDRLRRALRTGEPTRFDRYNEATDRWFKVRVYPGEDGVTACFYDITDERGEQLALQRKRRLFEAVFEGTEDALVVADTDRRITDFNPAAERLFGYDADEVLGENSRMLYANPDDYEQTGTQRFNEDAPERDDTYVVTYERADGTTFEGETLGTALEGPDGEKLAFLGSIRDVSSRIARETKRAERNDALRAFHEIGTDKTRSFEEQMDALLELGRDHLGVDVGLMSNIDGESYLVEHVCGSDDVQAGDQFTLGDTYCDRVVETGEQFAVSAEDSDVAAHPAARSQAVASYIGTPIVVDGDCYGSLSFSSTQSRDRPFTDGEQTFVRVLAQWVGKELSRQRNRDRAAAKQERLRQIVDMLPQLVFAKDENGEFLLANEALAEAYGTTVEELEGATDADFADSPEEVRQFREDDLAVIESGEPKEIPEESLTTAAGEELTMQTTKLPYDTVDTDTAAVLGVATDITALKDREAQIELQSEAMDVAMAGIAILDDDEYVYMNQAHADIFGYEPEELVGSEWRRFYDEVDIERFEQEVFPALADHGEWRGEAVGKRRDGSAVYQNLGLSLLDSGELICTNQDVTERKEREQELARQRTRIRALFDQSPDGIIVHDAEGTVIDANETQADQLGVDHETLLTMNVSEFEVGIDRDELTAVWAEMTAEETLKVEGQHRPADGDVFPVEVWVNKLAVGGKDRFIAVSRDISDRRAREQELRNLKERLDLAVDGANIGIWDWDMQTDEVQFNDQWAEMLGLTLSDVDPTLETWEERVHPADMPDVEAQLDAHMRGETDLYDCEHRMQTSGGDWKWIRDVGRIVERDDDGEPTRAVGIHLDVTDQKETELHLAEERDMFAQGPALVFKWENDEGWPVEYASENVAETFGYTPEQLTSGDVPYTDLVHDDDLDRVAREVDEQSDETTDRFSHDPYRMVTSDGEIRWVTDNTKIIHHDGEITHYLGYLIDITEQKRLEQSLRDSEESLRELTAIASDTDRTFEEKLSALLELGTDRLDVPFGFLNRIEDSTQHVVQAVGDHPDLQTGETAPKSESYCRKTVGTDRVLGIQNATAEGWADDPAYERFGLGCYLGASVYVDGTLYGTLCFAGDESHERAFDDTERAFVELLVQWVSYELASASFETKLREINETAQQLMGAPSRADVAEITTERAKTVLGMSMTGLWWYDEDVDALVPERQTDESTAVVGPQPTFDRGESLAWAAYESCEVRQYDDIHDLPGRYNEATDLRSEVIVPLGEHGIVIASETEPGAFSETDVTLLDVLSATVESALTRAQREEDLREARQKLEQSNEELEQFAYAASHDLQEPLRTVSSYLTLLERRYGDELDGDAREFLDFAVDGADRMREMIQALLTYSRVDTRGQGFEPVDVDTVFERVRQNLTVSIEEAGATVSTPETGLTVMGDRSQLAQLFQNLVENALKYNDGDPRVDVSVSVADEMVTVEVSDDGIGMEADQTDEIFEVFQRLHTREEFEGTGVGLAICRKIVDRHGGTVSVESTPGEGSTFTVTLPQGDSTDE